MQPPALGALLAHFDSLSEAERRDELIHLAEAAPLHEPKPGEQWEVEEVRKDHECSDTVGIHLRRDAHAGLQLAISHGCKVQTLTRALSVLLCRAVQGAKAEEALAINEEHITRIVGETLVQLRARTIFYILRRVHTAIRQLS
jgi:cysteine desulfuration protein SufE